MLSRVVDVWRAGEPMQKKRHSREEVATKLSKADELYDRGKTQAEIAQALGVSAMTYHRWRKRRSYPRLNGIGQEQVSSDLPPSAVEELRHENARLRQIVTDLSLEKLQLQEAVRSLKKQ
jgi:putative transposase